MLWLIDAQPARRCFSHHMACLYDTCTPTRASSADPDVGLVEGLWYAQYQWSRAGPCPVCPHCLSTLARHMWGHTCLRLQEVAMGDVAIWSDSPVAII